MLLPDIGRKAISWEKSLIEEGYKLGSEWNMSTTPTRACGASNFEASFGGETP